MAWRLKVLEYGKIKSAEIEAAPLTLFVGDNNSGKSYLMSLLWGIENLGAEALIHHEIGPDRKEADVLMNWIIEQLTMAWEKGSHTAQIGEVADELQIVLQEGLNQNKDRLIRRIFNSQDVRIKELTIELKNLERIFLKITKSNNLNSEKSGFLTIRSGIGMGFRMEFSEEKQRKLKGEFDWILLDMVVGQIMGIPVGDMTGTGRGIYLPAARTGFMLTKDIVNKVGRNAAFNVELDHMQLSPFTRPINQFLDVINDLTLSGNGEEKFQSIKDYLENGMAEGIVEVSVLPNREVSYVPAGQEKGMPLRVVSAVVTELSPLILILKHKEYLNTLFYEEPEICLHPQLQHKMAKVICRLVNAGLNMRITTHSDIVLQHINNMICLSKKENVEEICHRFDYTSEDLLRAEQTKVYQLKSKPGEMTEVRELPCGKNGFAIPTFNDALDKIMDEAYGIQE